MKVYPDTASGARDALMAMCDAETRATFSGARFFPDPSVQGVWGADAADGSRAIVYLAGYREPTGKIRKMNDFEIGEKP